MPKTSSTNATIRLVQGFRDQFAALFHEVAKFGVVGLSALVVDIGLFNLLRFSGGQGPMFDRPISAKIVSVAVTTALADNLSANVIGLGLGTLFRFWSYRKWVFPELANNPADRELAERDASTLI